MTIGTGRRRRINSLAVLQGQELCRTFLYVAMLDPATQKAVFEMRQKMWIIFVCIVVDEGCWELSKERS